MSQITLTAGSDATLNLHFRDGDATPLAVTNPTVILADGKLEGRITTELGAGVGDVTVHIEGSQPIRLGKYTFRIQVTKVDSDTVATPEITINVI